MIDWNKPVQVRSREGSWLNTFSVVSHRLSPNHAAIAWFNVTNEICVDVFSSDSPDIRNTPAPPKLVPFTEDTFPSGCVWMRCKGSNERHLVTCVTAFGVFRGTSLTRWNELMSDYEISVYGAGIWLPCGVMEVQK